MKSKRGKKFGAFRKNGSLRMNDFVEFYNEMSQMIGGTLIVAANFSIQQYLESRFFDISRFKNPYFKNHIDIENKAAYNNLMIRISSLNRLMHDIHRDEYMNRVCWELYDEFPSVEACAANAYYITLCEEWRLNFKIRSVDFDPIRQLIIAWIFEAIDNVIWMVDVEYEMDTVGTLDRSVPDFTYKHKIRDMIERKIIFPLMWVNKNFEAEIGRF